MGTSFPSSVFWFVPGFVLPSALLLAVVAAGALGLVDAGCSEVGGAVAEGGGGGGGGLGGTGGVCGFARVAVAVIAGSEGERRNGNDDG